MSIYDRLVEVLKNDDRFLSEDGILLRNAVYEAAMRMDADLIRVLLSDEATKSHFFRDIDGILVFDKVAFGWVVNNREFLPDSYTRFKNRIGLADQRDNMITTFNDIALVFPYKDCVLEGGQTREDQKRQERFYNHILAPDEVDRLLQPKVLSSAARVSLNHQENNISFSNEDNLIIQGNNLLVLASLLPRFERQVKCIYIDPPYNTGNDSFMYNDSFKRSTWLTFMKNRLSIAQRMLRSDGLIFIQINNKEIAYLKILCDEIFGESNFINMVTIQTATTASFRAINDCPVNVSEYILIYAKEKPLKEMNPIYRRTEYSEDYGFYILNMEEPVDKWEIVSVDSIIYAKENVSSWQEFKNKYGDNWKIIRYDMKAKFCLENSDRVVSLNTMQKPSKAIIEVVNMSKKNKGSVFVIASENGNLTYVYNGRTLAFYKKKIRDIDGVCTPSEIITNIWTDISFLSLGNEGGVDLPNGKKPESLIKRILELSTQEGDLVLDFFLGSGTTCAVAHKMKRRYIGIEQLNYGDNGSYTRLKNVIQGDSSGISQSVGWQGGGSFVYCELAKCNMKYVDAVSKASSEKELSNILRLLLDNGFISSSINPRLINNEMDTFDALPKKSKFQFIFDLLDKNMLYVNLSDIDDEEYAISDADKLFTHSFYNIGEV